MKNRNDSISVPGGRSRRVGRRRRRRAVGGARPRQGRRVVHLLGLVPGIIFLKKTLFQICGKTNGFFSCVSHQEARSYG